MDKKRVINAAVTAGLSLSMIMTSVPATALAEGDQTDSSTAVEQLSTMQVGVNYWDVENNKQVCEGSIEVASDATHVNTSALVDVPEGYELVVTGDLQIMGGWIFVQIQPASTITVEVNYWDTVNNKQAGTGYVTVDADAYNVNSSLLTDIPYGYELVNTGDIQIMDGSIYVPVKVAATKVVGVNYYDRENGVQAYEGTVTVAGDATSVNSSQLTDIPEGYELVKPGEFQINDRWIYVEVKQKVEDEDAQGHVTVVFKDSMSDYEWTWVGAPDDAWWFNPTESGAITAPEGYTFAGWSWDQEGSQMLGADSLKGVTGDVTVWAQWEKVDDVEDAEGHVNVTYYDTLDDSYEWTWVGAPDGGWWFDPTTSGAMVHDGYTFAGWSLNPDGTGMLDADSLVGTTGDVMVYAQWEKVEDEDPVETTYEVTFNYCLTNTENLVVTVKEGETVQAPTDPTCPGYTFTGWYVNPERTQLYNFASPVYEDMTLYAGWEEAADEGGETTTPDDTTAPGDSTDETVTPVEPAATDEATESDELPKTGDTTNNAAVAGVGIAGLIAAAASVILRRRNQQ